MTTTSPAVRITGPADLVGAIPYLLGFVPDRSVVAVALHGDSRSARLGLTLRVDLPPAPSVADCAAFITGHLVRAGAKATIVVLYADGEGLPCDLDQLIHELGRCTAAARVDLWDVLQVAKDAWRSCLCGDAACCPPGGTPIDSTAPSLVQVHAVAAGLSALPSRQALADTLKPAESRAVAAVSREISRVIARRASQSRNAVESRRARTVRMAKEIVYQRQLGWRTPLLPWRAARLLTGLADVGARDRCCQWTSGEQGSAAVSLWTELVRLSPPSYAAAPATLLAYVAWQQGFGALANIAVQRALADAPDYSLAQLIGQALADGLDPAHCRPEILLATVLRPQGRDGPGGQHRQRGEGRPGRGRDPPVQAANPRGEVCARRDSVLADKMLRAGSLGFLDVLGNCLEQFVSELRHRPGGCQLVTDLR
jgi:hypothetical protein